MAVVTYLLRADLRRRWRSLLMLTLLVAIVVAAVLATAAGARRTRTSFDRYLAAVHPTDALVSFDGAPPDLDAVEQVEGVEAAVGYRWFSVFPLGGPDGIYFIPLFVPSDGRLPGTYDRAPLVEGRRPDPSAPLEIALGERTARRLGVGVGDSFPAVSFAVDQSANGGYDEPKGPELSFDVVGIVRTPADVAAREEDIEPNLLSPAFGPTYEDQIGLFGTGMMLVLGPGASIESVSQDITALGDLAFETSFGTNVFRDQADPTLAAMATGLRVVTLIIAVAGGILVSQALARAATDRLGDHEGIRALGADRYARFLQLSLPSTLAAGLGILLGGALSLAVSPLVLWGLARRAELDPGIRVDGPVLVLGLMGSAVFLAITIAVVSATALRRQQRASSATARTSGVATWAAGLGASVPIVTGLRLALERGRGSRATPVAAAAVAAAVGGIGVMATVVFAGSLHHAVTTPAVYGWSVDGVLVGAENGDNLSDDDALAAALAADPGFDTVSKIANDVEVTTNGSPASAWVLQDVSGHSTFVMVRGREPVGPDEVAMGGETLDQLGLEVGDPVSVSGGASPRTMQIVGVTVLPVTSDGGSSSVGLAMRGDAAESIGWSGRCEADDECSRYLAFTTAPGRTATEATEPFVSDSVALVLPAPPAQVERLQAVDSLPRVLALALGLVAVLAVSYAASATVRRRRADLAMLRVLGLDARQLRRVVAVQVTILALGGAMIGVVLGVAVGRLLWVAVANSVPLPAVIAFPTVTVVLVPIAIGLGSHLGASAARRAAGRLRPAIALRAE